MALLTGAAHGIGAAFASGLLRSGFALAALDADAAGLERATAGLEAAAGRVLPIVADVTDEEAARAAVEETVERFGRLDALVNNAGLIFDVRAPISSLSLEAWRRSLDVNATGTFLMCRAAVAHLKRSGGGRIVNMTSALVGTGAPGRVHYISAKAAIIGLTRALARELGPDRITVNALAPGLVDSGPRALAFVGEDIFAFEEQRRAIKGRMRPDDLVGALLFLVSQESGFMTGQTLVIDGGVMLR